MYRRFYLFWPPITIYKTTCWGLSRGGLKIGYTSVYPPAGRSDDTPSTQPTRQQTNDEHPPENKTNLVKTPKPQRIYPLKKNKECTGFVWESLGERKPLYCRTLTVLIQKTEKLCYPPPRSPAHPPPALLHPPPSYTPTHKKETKQR